MTDDMHKKTRNLIHDVERKDKQFRVAQVIFNVLIVTLLVLAIYLGYQALGKDQHNRDIAVQKIIAEIREQGCLQSN